MKENGKPASVIAKEFHTSVCPQPVVRFEEIYVSVGFRPRSASDPLALSPRQDPFDVGQNTRLLAACRDGPFHGFPANRAVLFLKS
jgi:hypothetical protein